MDVGTVLTYDIDGVRGAIDDVEAVRFAMVIGVWEELAPGFGVLAAEAAYVMLSEYLRAGRWRLADGIGRVEEVFGRDQEGRASARVSRWLAQEMGGGVDSIRDAVDAWDVAGLPDKFAMARYILLREDVAGLQLLGELVDKNVVQRVDLETWPLFDRFRDHGELDDIWNRSQDTD